MSTLAVCAAAVSSDAVRQAGKLLHSTLSHGPLRGLRPLQGPTWRPPAAPSWQAEASGGLRSVLWCSAGAPRRWVDSSPSHVQQKAAGILHNLLHDPKCVLLLQ